MEKPDVDSIEGLSPAIAIEQKTAGHNPRSTVGTVTEIYDYLRLLWARVGVPHCPNDGTPIERSSASQITDTIIGWPEGTRIEVLAPLVRGRKGEFRELFDEVRKRGFVRVRVDGETYDLNEVPALNRRQNHDVAVVVDRLVVRPQDRGRLADSIETALKAAEGVVEVVVHGGTGERGTGERAASSRSPVAPLPRSTTFSERFACPVCGLSLPELEPRQFSFNSPFGACPECHGVGLRREVNAELILGDATISILEGVVLPWGEPSGYLRKVVLPTLAKALKFDLGLPWGKIPEPAQQALLHGLPGKKLKFQIEGTRSRDDYESEWEGIIANVSRRYRESSSDAVRTSLEQFMVEEPCRACGGKRLKPESLSVHVGSKGIGEVVEYAGVACLRVLCGAADPRWTASPRDSTPRSRDRYSRKSVIGCVSSGTWGSIISPWVARRARCQAAKRSGFGWRPRSDPGSPAFSTSWTSPVSGCTSGTMSDCSRTLRELRDLGNTVLVVEHDEETIRAADHVVDLGPRAGRFGGEVVVEGTVAEILRPSHLTHRALPAERAADSSAFGPSARRSRRGVCASSGAKANNLKNLTVDFPLGLFVAVTGVSGSGKSTLVTDILYQSLARHFYRAKVIPGPHTAGSRASNCIDKVIDIDQSPIGRTPRSNPATYTGLFTPIRELFTQLPEAKLRGYGPGRFSFNVKGGRCEACEGDGLVKIEMHFLPDVYVPCEVCKGKRYNRETLEVRYKGRSIAEVLDLTVGDALEFFENQRRISEKLDLLNDVGLGYIHLGQAATTLSGGEAQRVKLATELAKRDTGRTLYILDEPTTGLHFEDVRLLLEVLHRLVDKGNSVLVIEHNLDVIKTADWIIDLGPEGGEKGGEIVAQGTPEDVARSTTSHTGRT